MQLGLVALFSVELCLVAQCWIRMIRMIWLMHVLIDVDFSASVSV